MATASPTVGMNSSLVVQQLWRLMGIPPLTLSLSKGYPLWFDKLTTNGL